MRRQKRRNAMNKAIRAILALIDTCLLVYLVCFNVYMAYRAIGVVAAILTLVFTPISFFIWFIVVVVNNGIINAYCLTWILSLILAFIVTRAKK